MKDRSNWADVPLYGEKVSELIEASECIANNNKSFNGEMLYNIDSYFDGWKRVYIKKRMIQLYGDKANVQPLLTN